MKNKWSIVLIIVSVCFCLLVYGVGCQRRASREPKTVPIDLSRITRNAGVVTFSEIYNVGQLPRAVTAQLPGGFANPTGKFRVSDASDSSLPLRRLIVAGSSDQYFIVHYEKGGISNYFATALLKGSSDKAELVWVSACPPMTDLHELKAEMESGKLKNQLGTMAY